MSTQIAARPRKRRESARARKRDSELERLDRELREEFAAFEQKCGDRELTLDDQIEFERYMLEHWRKRSFALAGGAS